MIVADTNLIAYLLISGAFTEMAEKVSERDDDWVAPPIWRHELLNVLATSARAGVLTLDKASRLWANAADMVREVDVPELAVLNLSVTTNFGTYDCNYVVLARTLAVPLVTADKKMLKRFNDVAVSIADFATGA